MWDGTPPRGARGPRGNGEERPSRRYERTPPPPYRSPGPPRRPDDPYRPIGDPSGARLPVPYPRGTLGTFNRVPAAGQDFGPPDVADEAETHHRLLGFAIFHDGNPGHFWRGAVASTLGEATLSAGVIMWLAALTLSPMAVALAVAAFGAPFVLAGPLAARFESASEPGGLLRWIGRIRLLFVLALIAMHFRTILPILYLLLFTISFCGRLHDALRVAVIRTCLAPGEPEHVANDMHIGFSLAAVLGPLFGTLCYILLGERLPLVAVGAAAIFLISLNSEGFLDTLPPSRRDFLLATPESAMASDEWSDELDTLDDDPDDDDEDDVDPATRRERFLPSWYQLGPSSAARAIGEIRVGLSLAGATQASAVALWGLCALGLAGGALAVLEVFFILQSLQLPPFYLGPLLACEGAGLAIGALLGGVAPAARPWRSRFLASLIASGAALLLLVLLPPMLPLALAIYFALGVFNALTVQAARQGLLAGATSIGKRALAAAENSLVAFSALLGALLLAGAYGGDALPVRLPFSLADLSAAVLILFLGAGLIIAAAVFAPLLGFKPRAATRLRRAADSSGASRVPGRLAALDDEESAADEDYPLATGEHDVWAESAVGPEDVDDFAASYGYQGTGYGPAYDDDDDEPPSRRGKSARRPSPRGRDRDRPRW